MGDPNEWNPWPGDAGGDQYMKQQAAGTLDQTGLPADNNALMQQLMQMAQQQQGGAPKASDGHSTPAGSILGGLTNANHQASSGPMGAVGGMMGGGGGGQGGGGGGGNMMGSLMSLIPFLLA